MCRWLPGLGAKLLGTAGVRWLPLRGAKRTQRSELLLHLRLGVQDLLQQFRVHELGFATCARERPVRTEDHPDVQATVL